MNLSALKTYDLRGEYPNEIGTVLAMTVPIAFAQTMNVKFMAIGHDSRPASKELYSYLLMGAALAGVRTLALGETTAEVVTHAVATAEFDGNAMDGGLMMTAGHSPLDWTGIRFYGFEGASLGPEAVASIFDIAKTLKIVDKAPTGYEQPYDPHPAYLNHMMTILRGYGGWAKDMRREFKVVLDPNGGHVGELFYALFMRLKLDDRINIEWLGQEGHPNPRFHARQGAMAKKIKETGADLGLSWDSSGTRLVVFGSDGEALNGALVGAFLGQVSTAKHPKETLVVDHRTIYPMQRIACDNGSTLGVTVQGTAPMISSMRTVAAAFGAEHCGRYYFKEMWWADSGILAAFLVMQSAFLTLTPFHKVVAGMGVMYPCSVEYSFLVDAPNTVIAAVAETFRKVAHVGFAGPDLSARSKDPANDWRFVLRPAMTHPGVIRLVAEGVGNGDMVMSLVAEVARLIQYYQTAMKEKQHG